MARRAGYVPRYSKVQVTGIRKRELREGPEELISERTASFLTKDETKNLKLVTVLFQLSLVRIRAFGLPNFDHPLKEALGFFRAFPIGTGLLRP